MWLYKGGEWHEPYSNLGVNIVPLHIFNNTHVYNKRASLMAIEVKWNPLKIKLMEYQL